MGKGGLWFFGEKDSILVAEISKIHEFPKEVVEKHYLAMIEGIRNEVLSAKVED